MFVIWPQLFACHVSLPAGPSSASTFPGARGSLSSPVLASALQASAGARATLPLLCHKPHVLLPRLPPPPPPTPGPDRSGSFSSTSSGQRWHQDTDEHHHAAEEDLQPPVHVPAHRGEVWGQGGRPRGTQSSWALALHRPCSWEQLSALRPTQS